MNVLRNWPLILITIVWFFVFWQMNTGQTVVGFRDSAYLYYPYFQWIDQQWAAGHIPLWNPYCDLGHPVVADGTSSVFYPGKLIFFCRFLSYPSRYGIYLSLHVLLAAIGAYWLTKRLGATNEGAGVAAASYAFGGSVLFQTVNVAYLVSAAWLPFAMLFVWQMFKWRSNRHAIFAGASCAMMVLGGDPQMAYVTGLIAIGSLVFQLSYCRRRLTARRLWLSKARAGLKLCLVMALAMAVLSAIQVLPTYVWSQQSVRGKSLEGQTSSVYQFSQPPWSLVELVWPNISGKPFPVYQRWADRFPGSDRIWTPSLYCGGLTFLLAVCGLRFSGRRRKTIWLTAIAGFFSFASFGWYGAVWIQNEVAIGIGQSGSETEPFVGGLYWVMTIVLPKFAMFRYPAKLFVVASLCICVLAGLNLDRIRIGRISIWLTVFLLGSAIGFWFLVSGQLLSQTPGNHALFGPFDIAACNQAIQISLLHTLVCLSIMAVMMFWKLKNRGGARKLYSCIGSLLFFTVIVDVLLANMWLIPQVPSDVFDRTTDAALQLNPSPSVRLIRNCPAPADWQETSSHDRLAEIASWQKNSLHPKHNLTVPANIVGSFSSIQHPANKKFSAEIGAINSRLFDCGVIEIRDDLTIQVAGDDSSTSKFRLVERFVRPEQMNIRQLMSTSPASECELDLVADSPNLVELKITTKRPVALLYLALADPGWQVLVENGGEIQTDLQRPSKADIFLVDIPSGENLVQIRYRPVEFWIGMSISILGWLAATCFGIYACATSRYRKRFGFK